MNPPGCPPSSAPMHLNTPSSFNVGVQRRFMLPEVKKGAYKGAYLAMTLITPLTLLRTAVINYGLLSYILDLFKVKVNYPNVF